MNAHTTYNLSCRHLSAVCKCALWEVMLLFQDSHFCLTSATPIHFSQMNVLFKSHASGEHQTMNHLTKKLNFSYF